MKRRLGIVPRALLRASLAGAIPAAVFPSCSDTSTVPDAFEFQVDARTVDVPNLGAPDAREFAVDAASPDARSPDAPEFAVDAPSTDAPTTPDAAS